MISFGKYSKFITAAVGAAVAWGYQVLASAPDDITGVEWIDGLVLVATALGVYTVANREI